MVENSTDWTREFARSGVRDSLAQIIDDSTPGVIERLGTDPAAYGELIVATHLVATEADELLRETIISARQAGLNWEKIGNLLGVSRQAAQQRFGGGIVDLAPVTDPNAEALPPIGTRVTLEHTFTATDELPILNRAGLYGWHGVSFTSSTWTIEFDNRQWQHAVSAGKPPNGFGWERIGRWAFQVFWARPTELLILPGNPPPDAFLSDKKLRAALKGETEMEYSLGNALKGLGKFLGDI